MDLLLPLLGVAVVLGVAHLWKRVRQERAELSVRRAHYLLGERAELAEGPRSLGLEGELDGCRVRLHQVARKVARDERVFFELAAAPPDGPANPTRRGASKRPPKEVIPTGISIRPNGLNGVYRGFLGRETVDTGDLDFESQSIITAKEPSELLAFLDARTRADLVDLLETDGFVTCGELRFERKLSLSGDRLVRDLDALVERVKSLAERARPVSQKLLSNARHDPIEEVRRRNLAALLAGFADTREAREGAFLAMSRNDVELWQRAAELLGVGATQEARQVMANRDRPSRIRQAAVAFGLTQLPAREATIVLEPALDAGADPLRAEAARGLHHFDRGRALSFAERWLGDDDFAKAACGSLAKLGGPDVEEHLIPLLERSSLDVQRAACNALAECGSATAVEPLSKLAHGLLRSGPIKMAARHAIDTIQERLGRLPGALSLADFEGEEGRLSVVEEAGGLALAEE